MQWSYYTYQWEEDGMTQVMEAGEDHWCTRCLFYTKDKVYNSYRIKMHATYSLPEASLEEGLSLLTEISREEFMQQWNQSLAPFREDFNRVKAQYSIGSDLEVSINCFYPQGVMLQTPTGFNGLANYLECKAQLGTDKMYPQTSFRAKITGFDDENQLLLVKPISTFKEH